LHVLILQCNTHVAPALETVWAPEESSEDNKTIC
jgi:hypothetical protein